MLLKGLKIPDVLVYLVKSGFWPRNGEEAMRQNLHPLVPDEVVNCAAPDEARIYFEPFPFVTVADAMKNGEVFWNSTDAAPWQLDFNKALIIGDFGLGSDAPIILDYQLGNADPVVKRLRWSKAVAGADRNEWIVFGGSFRQFCKLLNISTTSPMGSTVNQDVSR